MLELVNVAKTYESPGSSERVDVLKDISLDLKGGESIAVVGPSGSGKSTLLNIIGAMDKPSAGKVLLEGRDLADLDETELAGIRNHRIGFVFQSHHLLSQCTVLENVLVPTLASDTKESAKDRQERAMQLLENVGLQDHLRHRPGELSGGQRQRVAVVRALINMPALLLADEPTGSLDRQATDNIIELLVELNLKHRLALIVVTHSMRLAERMGRVFQLSDGVLRKGADIE
jgi:ABC-type lipoprotein export system ATPase subunit